MAEGGGVRSPASGLDGRSSSVALNRSVGRTYYMGHTRVSLVWRPRRHPLTPHTITSRSYRVLMRGCPLVSRRALLLRPSA